jgi:hypothetical protein
MFLGSKVRPMCRADNLTVIWEPMSRQCGILNISQPYRPPRLVAWIPLLYFNFTFTFIQLYHTKWRGIGAFWPNDTPRRSCLSMIPRIIVQPTVLFFFISFSSSFKGLTERKSMADQGLCNAVSAETGFQRDQPQLGSCPMAYTHTETRQLLNQLKMWDFMNFCVDKHSCLRGNINLLCEYIEADCDMTMRTEVFVFKLTLNLKYNRGNLHKSLLTKLENNFSFPGYSFR